MKLMKIETTTKQYSKKLIWKNTILLRALRENEDLYNLKIPRIDIEDCGYDIDSHVYNMKRHWVAAWQVFTRKLTNAYHWMQ